MNRRTRDTRTRTRGALAAMAAALLLGACAGNAPPAPPAPAPSAASPLPDTVPTPRGLLLTADFGADTVSFVDPERGTVASVTVGRAPYGMALGADGRAWVATAEGWRSSTRAPGYGWP